MLNVLGIKRRDLRLEYVGGEYSRTLTMEEVLRLTKLRKANLPNKNCVAEEVLRKSTALLPKVMVQATTYMKEKAQHFQVIMGPKLDAEVNKLIALEERHKAQVSKCNTERSRQEKRRYIDELFDGFVTWVEDSMTIQADNPYLRVITVLTGVE